MEASRLTGTIGHPCATTANVAARTAGEASISFIVPVGPTEEQLAVEVRSIAAAFTGATADFEILLVASSAEPAAMAAAHAVAQQSAAVRLIACDGKLSYGAAVRAGLQQAGKNYVAFAAGPGRLAAADLTWISSLAARCDVVCGGRIDRQEGWFRRLSSKTCSLAADLLLGTRVHDCGGAFKLLRRDAARARFDVRDDVLARRAIVEGAAAANVRGRARCHSICVPRSGAAILGTLGIHRRPRGVALLVDPGHVSRVRGRRRSAATLDSSTMARRAALFHRGRDAFHATDVSADRAGRSSVRVDRGRHVRNRRFPDSRAPGDAVFRQAPPVVLVGGGEFLRPRNARLRGPARAGLGRHGNRCGHVLRGAPNGGRARGVLGRAGPLVVPGLRADEPVLHHGRPAQLLCDPGPVQPLCRRATPAPARRLVAAGRGGMPRWAC